MNQISLSKQNTGFLNGKKCILDFIVKIKFEFKEYFPELFMS